MHAIVSNTANLENRSALVNAGRTDGTYFYVNGNSVSVSNPYHELSEDAQRSELEWFLSDREFEIQNN